jgi:hypothetical protein
MIVAIVGSRDWQDLDRVARYVAAMATKHPQVILVSGNARGVDWEAEQAAHRCKLQVISYRPYMYRGMAGHCEYSIQTVTVGDQAEEIVVRKHRRINPPWFKGYAQAAYHRNRWIVDDADHVVAFWNGTSRGTADTIDVARHSHKPVHLYQPTERSAT